MGIIRTNKSTGNFFIASKHYVEDTNLSWKAKGIMSYLFSKPDDWQIYQTQLEKVSTDGKASVRTTINELLEKGYMTRKSRRKHNGDFDGYDYTLHEYPKNNDGVRKMEDAKMDIAKMEDAEMVIAKSDTTNNDLTNNDLTNNNNTKNDSSSTQPSPFNFYQENGFGMLQPFIAEKIGWWIDDFKDNGSEIVIEAMKEAVNNNVTNWNYVNSILNAWNNDGVKNLEDVKARNNKRSNKDKVLTGQDKLERMKHDPSYWD